MAPKTQIIVHNAYNNPDDMAEWDFTFICSWSQSDPPTFPDSKAIITDIKQRAVAGAVAQPFRAIIQAIDESQKAWANFLPYWPTQGWADHPARGRVTLAGDAAHPMTPHRGQGLNNAILDCRDFVREIEETVPSHRADDQGARDKAFKEAVERYEVNMWERGHDAVLSNLENSIAVHDWATLMKAPIMRHGVTKQKVDRMNADEGKC